MLIYDNPDFTGLAHLMLLKNMANVTFNSDLHIFFDDHTAHWSTILVGRFRRIKFCDTPIPNRRQLDAAHETLTFTVETNLDMEFYFDGMLMASVS